MKQEVLYQFMRVRFREAGFLQGEIDVHIAKVKDRYKNMSDAEIESDLMRRGGPSKVVAHMIEQRNTVLMKDSDYLSFIEQAKKQEKAVTVDEDVKTYTPPKKDGNDSVFGESNESEASVPVSDAEIPSKNDKDPLQDWFAEQKREADPSDAGEKDRTEEMIPPLFRKEVQETRVAAPGIQRASNHDDALKKDSASRTAYSSIHTIPVADSDEQKEMPTQSISKVTRGRPTDRAASQNVSAGQRGRDLQRKHPAEHVGAVQKKKKARIKLTNLSEYTYWGEGSDESVRRFIILFLVSLPFVLVFLAAFTILSAAVIVAISALIALCIAVLVAEIAIGSVIALIGLIYGASQVFLSLPIGLFELGLGVVVIGVTMFVGILTYNFAVRFLPFLLRQYIRFIKFFRRFIQDLYYYLKGECYRR